MATAYGWFEVTAYEDGDAAFTFIPLERIAKEHGYVKERTCTIERGICSECGVRVVNLAFANRVGKDDGLSEWHWEGSNFCPNCGAKVIEEEMNLYGNRTGSDTGNGVE